MANQTPSLNGNVKIALKWQHCATGIQYTNKHSGQRNTQRINIKVYYNMLTTE